MKSLIISFMYIYIAFVIKICILVVVVTSTLTKEYVLFSVSNIFRNKRSNKGCINKGRWKRKKVVARRATKIRSYSTLYKPDQQIVSGTKYSCFATLIYY